MKKKTLFIVISATVVLILSIVFRTDFRDYFQDENDFRIADTSAVSSIEILAGDSVILSREGDSWTLNNELPVSSVQLTNFLFSFHRMGVRGISKIPEISNEKGTRVRIIEGRKKHFFRFYSIDGGSYMLREGGSRLYEVEVAGFPDIRLDEIITGDPDKWKNRILLDLAADEIKSVSVFHPSSPENDFRIEVSNGKPILFEGSGIEMPASMVDYDKINFYLSYFTNVFYDYTWRDSLNPAGPARWIINAEDLDGKKYKLSVFPLISSSETDMFKALVEYNHQPGLKVTRYMVLDLLLQDLDHFLLSDPG